MVVCVWIRSHTCWTRRGVRKNADNWFAQNLIARSTQKSFDSTQIRNQEMAWWLSFHIFLDNITLTMFVCICVCVSAEAAVQILVKPGWKPDILLWSQYGCVSMRANFVYIFAQRHCVRPKTPENPIKSIHTHTHTQSSAYIACAGWCCEPISAPFLHYTQLWVCVLLSGCLLFVCVCELRVLLKFKRFVAEQQTGRFCLCGILGVPFVQARRRQYPWMDIECVRVSFARVAVYEWAYKLWICCDVCVLKFPHGV